MLSPRPPQNRYRIQFTSMSEHTLPWHRGHWLRYVYTLRVLAREAIAPLNLVNYCLGMLLWRIGLIPEALATIGVVTTNLVLLAVQMGRAQAALRRMQQAFQAPVAVWHQDRLVDTAPDAIRPGDILMLRPGDRIPTAVTILEASGFVIDMAVQTGESEPVSGRVDMTIPPGCTVRSGAGWVVSTAPIPVYHPPRFDEGRKPGSPSAQLVGILQGSALCAAIVALLTMGWGALHTYEWVQYIAALTVVIGLIPNALVLYAAVAHANAAVPLTRQGMIINHPGVLERMADVDVVCFDKTGTLTTNSLTITAIIPFAVDESTCIDLLGAYAAADGAGNQSSLTIARTFPREPMVVASSTAFESERKWSSITGLSGTYVLGAPDVLDASLTPEWHHVSQLSQQHPEGRVLLFLRVPDDWFAHRSNAIPLGAVIMQDELRAGVHDALAYLRHHNRRVLVLSGDNPQAVQRVAIAAGMSGGQCIHAEALAVPDGFVVSRLADVTVIGRMLPADKARVVRAFQMAGQRVAFVGDGFNDLDALRTADVAITFGAAHAVVRDTADVVIVGAELTALTLLQHRGEHVSHQLYAIGMHVVSRVALCAVVWVGTLGASLPTWRPFDSTAIALFGVALPSILLVLLPHPRRNLESIGRIIAIAVAIGLVTVLGWWVVVTVCGVTDVRWLTASVIISLWVLLVRRVRQ